MQSRANNLFLETNVYTRMYYIDKTTFARGEVRRIVLSFGGTRFDANWLDEAFFSGRGRLEMTDSRLGHCLRFTITHGDTVSPFLYHIRPRLYRRESPTRMALHARILARQRNTRKRRNSWQWKSNSPASHGNWIARDHASPCLVYDRS